MSDIRDYRQAVPDSHRKTLGQFFTHPYVANFMVNWVLGSDVRELFDPAFGLGAFRPKCSDVRFSAAEVDETVVEFYRKNYDSDVSFISKEDYLCSWEQSHANIVCNPPYMRFQKFTNREQVIQKFEDYLNIRLSGYTNTASAFLLKSLSELDGTGRLCYIMPLEFLNAGYGTLVKEKLLEQRHLVGIISLECEKDIFPDATTSVGIILYDCKKVSNEVQFYSIKNISELENFEDRLPNKVINASDLDAKAKWLPYFKNSSVQIDQKKTVSLDYYGRFSRGIATGANEFFVLSKTKVQTLGLHECEFVPCITRSAQITKPIFDDEDLENSIDSDKPVFLLSVNGSASQAAREYIQLGESHGYHERFLTKHRNPWYKTEIRSPAPLLLGVFSRGGYKIIRNSSRALNLTCYHGFTPNLFGMQYVDHLFLFFLSKVGREIVSLSMRSYGDALDKFEPNDLNTATVPSPEFFDKFNKNEIDIGVKHVEKTGYLPDGLEERFRPLIQKAQQGAGGNALPRVPQL